MPQRAPEAVTPQDILEFWFPGALAKGDADDHAAFWRSRMQGGMDTALIGDWAEVTHAAARGAYDAWAADPRGRLALLLTLDQFPRSVWRDTPAAYGQDIKACRLVLEALENGHFEALDTPWERNFPLIVLSHCEGPDHLARMDLCVELADTMVAPAFPRYDHIYGDAGIQPRRVREIIRRFGRHPHRNAVLGRVSTPEEEDYIATGDFPHLRAPDAPA
ncbi:DUF924 domain-containing protein [Psychromarinibacter sp. C21-152]|uniref:DUF924 domain-containing protein n=1 Tax=Psychromarinibacter sediminicola TaxID=3033385 RepID=A0AAE3NRE0_9RHOB|nr:DUF924 family protein [Psychromarinibacter sediminicola]MDF0600687.1 DUF924 domain-containing protein [Psychromarinibacter sediminicola]